MTPQDDTTYTGIFAYNSYTVNVTSSVSGCTVTAMVSDSDGNTKTYEKASSFTAAYGNVIIFTSVPSLNYKFSKWTIVGLESTYTNTTSSTSIIANENFNSTIPVTAAFAYKTGHTLKATKENGSLGTIAIEAIVDDAVVETHSESDGAVSFTGREGVEYTAIATVTDTKFNQFTGWFNSSGSLLSSSTEYVFTQGTSAITLVAKFAAKSLYTAAIKVSPNTSSVYESGDSHVGGSTASITSPSSPDSTSGGVNYYLAQTIEVTAVPGAGWEAVGINVQNDYDAQSVTHVDGNKNLFRFSLAYSSVLKVNFQLVSVTPTVSIHSKSVGKGTVSIASLAQGGDTSNMHYGDSVKYTATPSSGYGFGGWYNSSGKLVSSDQEYTFTMTGDIELIAKFSATIKISFAGTESVSGSVSMNGSSTSVKGTQISAQVPLGDSIAVKAVPDSASKSYFGSWFLASDTGFENPLSDYGAEASVEVDDNIALVARFVTEADALFVAVENVDNDTSSVNNALGSVSATGYENELTESEYNSGLNSLLGTSGAVYHSGAAKYYKFIGTVSSVFSASTLVGKGFMNWSALYVDPKTKSVTASPVVLSTASTGNIVVNRHYIVRAVWGSARKVDFVLKMATGNTSTMGGISVPSVVCPIDSSLDTVVTETIDGIQFTYGIHPANASTNVSAKTKESSIGSVSVKNDEVTLSIVQGSVVTFGASIKNGYLFSKWTLDESGSNPFSTLQENTVTVNGSVSYYVSFVQDTNAIYRWDYSSADKTIKWRSGRVVFPKPLNPVCARVYATGYDDPLRLGVYMFSAPNTSAPTGTYINPAIPSQDAIRLKQMRPEKYLEIEVQAAHEIDEVAVATSMKGLEA